MSNQLYENATLEFNESEIIEQARFIRCYITATKATFKTCVFESCEIVNAIETRFIQCDFGRAIVVRNSSNAYFVWGGDFSDKAAYRVKADRNFFAIVGSTDPYIISGVNYVVKETTEGESKEIGKAVRELESAYQRIPRDIPFMYGDTYQRSKNYDLAIQEYNRAIQLDPDYARGYQRVSVSYHAKGEYQQAIQNLDRAIEIEPDNSRYYFNRGLAYFMLEEYSNALEDYNSAIRLNPQDVNSYYNRSSVLLRLGLYEAAIQDYNVILSLNPKDAEIFYWRGQVHLRLKMIDVAHADFQKAAELGKEEANKYL